MLKPNTTFLLIGYLIEETPSPKTTSGSVPENLVKVTRLSPLTNNLALEILALLKICFGKSYPKVTFLKRIYSSAVVGAAKVFQQFGAML